jgi:hypothetical protein
MIATKELIDHTIKQLPDFSDEQLVYYYKCSLSQHSPAQKVLFTKLIKAIEAERKARNKIQTLPEKEEPDAPTD